MVSVAPRGNTERIAARIFFIMLRAGSGTLAMYSSTAFAPVSGMLRKAADFLVTMRTNIPQTR
jgi:hypothetical protein